MLIEYFGHACFRLTQNNYRIVIDPYGPDMIPGLKLPALEAHQVLCTHEHHDHNYREGVHLTFAKNTSPFTITEIPTFHDDAGGSQRGPNKIFILETDNVKIAHCGDLGCALTKDQIAKMQSLDYLMIPVGGHYTIGPKAAKAIIEQLKPKVTVPMHYKDGSRGFPILKDIDDFLDLFSEKMLTKHPNRRFDTNANSSQKVLVFNV